MFKRILLGGIVLWIALPVTLCPGQDGENSTWGRVFGGGQNAPRIGFLVRQSDEPIDQLRGLLMEQSRSTAKALNLLEAVKRQRDQEARKGAAEDRSREGDDGFRAVYTIKADGSSVRYLTAAPGMISSSSPEMSHDGTMVAFDAVPVVGALGDAHLFVTALEGPFKGMFKDFGCGNVPTWSLDDKQIAYMLNPGNPCGLEWGVWIMDADGSNRKRLCDGWYPRFSPDGKLLHVFAPSASAIHVIEPDGSNERQVVGKSIDVKYGGGTWSPDGNRMVFVGTRDGKEHLATVAVDDRKEQSVSILYTEQSNERELIGPPAWSPDGKMIVFAIHDKRGSGNPERRWHDTYLYTISAQLPDEPALLEQGRKGLINRSPIWSPDGKWILFSSER